MPNFICLDCKTINTFNNNCTNRYCSNCNSYSLLTEHSFNLIKNDCNKLCFICTNYKQVAIINNTPIEMCKHSNLNLKELIKCPLNKW